MATYTPPPYFPQNIAPPDPEEMRKRRLKFYGCISLAVLALLAFIGGIIWLIFRFI